MFFFVCNAGQVSNSYTPSSVNEDNVSSGGASEPFKIKPERLGGIVYSRVPRTIPSDITTGQFTSEKTTIDGTTYTNFDIYDQLSETGDDNESLQAFNGPGQLVFLDGEGDTHILFDCMDAATVTTEMISTLVSPIRPTLPRVI